MLETEFTKMEAFTSNCASVSLEWPDEHFGCVFFLTVYYVGPMQMYKNEMLSIMTPESAA